MAKTWVKLSHLNVDALITVWEAVETIWRYRAAEMENELERLVS